MKFIRLLSVSLIAALMPVMANAANYSYPTQTIRGISRADFIRIVMERTGGGYLNGTHCFKDVQNQHYAREVCAAKQLGFITGNPDGTFRPNNPVSLIEAAAVIVRAERVSVGGDSIWYRPYIEKLAEWNAIPAGIYNILDPVSHEHVIEMLDEVMDRDDDEDDEDDDDDSDNDDDDVKVSIEVSDKTPEPGDRITYRIRLKNVSDDDVENLDITAFLDSDMNFIYASDSGDEDDDEVEWENIDIDEDKTFTLLLTVEIDDDADDGDTLRLRVEADDSRVTNTIRVDDDDDDDEGKIRISITDSDDPVEPGDLVTYRIRIENEDDEDIELEVIAELDSKMDFVSASDDGDEERGEVEWDDIELDEDDEITLTLTVRIKSSADDGEELVLRVTANDEEEIEETEVEDDDDDDNNDDEDVSITITDSKDPAEVGDEVRYQIRIRNNENHDINIDVRAELDEAMSALSSSDGGDLDGDIIEWDNIHIDEDETKTIILIVRINNKADDGDVLRLTVEAGDDEDVETTRIED